MTMSTQMNAILHHPEFQELETVWRGFWMLVLATDGASDVEVKALNISKRELSRTLRKFRGQRLGPVADLPPVLRGGVRPARRRAVRRDHRGLRVRPQGRRRGGADRHVAHRRGGACAFIAAARRRA
jgi:hypothetical protein